ncbi:MAG: hypothetical protein WCX48_12220, partial [Bacteroidales bacterium]
LSKRLVSLRIVRDSTLFAMIMGKHFVWIEVVGLILALLTIPVLLYYSSKVAGNWIIDGILAQKWAFQKGLIFLVTLFALGLASLLSVMSFERKKRQLFEADADRRAERKKAAKPKAKPVVKPEEAAPKVPEEKPGAKSGTKPGAKPTGKQGPKVGGRETGKK